MLAKLKSFFEDNDLAKKAAESIRNGRTIALNVDGAGYTFTKEGGRNVLRDGAPQSPDLTFHMPTAMIEELVTKKFETVGQVGLHIFDKMLSNDPTMKVRVKIEIGVLGLVTGGYLGVLTAGGGDVAKFLATKGLGNMGKLKDAISKLRG